MMPEEQSFSIVVNGRKKEVTEKELSYWEVIRLAFPDAEPHPLIFFTVTFRKGKSDQKKGQLVEDESVHVHEGMIFDVDRTDRS
jgi:hypothetical protein